MGEGTAKLLTISQAAARIGVHQNTLRHWVDKGLVPVTMLPSGYRRFSVEQVEQIKRGMVPEAKRDAEPGQQAAAATLD
jgi:excisionase family DNA binding protein